MFNHIHDALGHVQEIKRRLLERESFRGYSGPARALGGVTALFAAALMSLQAYPKTLSAHIFGWGTVFFLGLLLNYGALGWWYFRLDQEERALSALSTTRHTVPPLLVGAILSFSLLLHQSPDMLFAVWMCLFGLVNLSARETLPKTIALLGWYYIVCGCCYALLWPNPSFVNPWPMGLVFFFGECTGGIIIAQHRSTLESIDTNESDERN